MASHRQQVCTLCHRRRICQPDKATGAWLCQECRQTAKSFLTRCAAVQVPNADPEAAIDKATE